MCFSQTIAVSPHGVYIFDIYHAKGDLLAERGVAKLFRNGRSQAVRLPREFRFEGTEVRVRHISGGVLLEPLISDPAKWFAVLDRLKSGVFMEKGRRQPVTPRRGIFR
jgi:antitoxin VapB